MNRKRTNNGKSVRQLEGQVMKQERNMYQDLMNLVKSDKLNISPHQLQVIAKALKAKASFSIDIGYIKTVLFPELYSYDIPQPLSSASFCRFTDKQEATINTGNNGVNGSGIILWYPKTNSGPSLFFYPSTTTALQNIDSFPIPLAAGNLKTAAGNLGWRCGVTQTYDGFVAQTALVAASISLSYVGQVQTESGYFVGSQLFSSRIDTLTIDDIENGQFRVLAKPGDGVRMIYLPKDITDYQYYPTKYGLSHNSGTTGKDEDTFNVPVGYAGLNGAASVIAGGTYTTECPCIAIYWKGLPANLDVLRIDTTRKFNGIPRSNFRDIVEVTRPRRTYDSKKTTDVIQQLIMSVPQVGGHTIKQMDHVSDQIQQYLPNIGHLYAQGSLKEGMGLTGLSQQLALQQAGLEGPSMQIGQAWE